MKQQLITYLRAGYPGLAIVTPEEIRAEAEIASASSSLQRQLHAWSSSEGLLDTTRQQSRPCPDPVEALRAIASLFTEEGQRHIVVMRDLQLYLDHNDPLLVRELKDLLRTAKVHGHSLILLSCRIKLPPELDHEITRIDFGLPDAGHLGEVLDGIAASAGLQPPEPAERECLVNAALGLTTIEAENIFALSVVGEGKLDPRVISREKARAIKRNGLIEVIEDHPRLEDIGGLDTLKAWLQHRAGAFGSAARTYGLPAPKGLLIVGIPGTGKSLTAKATAAVFGIPLLRLDMGRVFGGIVGQSESNLRSVIQTAEAIAPCVLWIDEIEKGFSGTKSSGNTDGGTSARVFGSFLSWMQEKEKEVFVVATANDVSKLPPEFVRKGRFDELFFVDLPSSEERKIIWNIVIRKYGRKPSKFDQTSLIHASNDLTGAEIEAVFVEALHHAYGEGREPTLTDLSHALSRTIPLAKQMEGEITRLRGWAQGRARTATAVAVTVPRRPDHRRKVSQN